MTEILPDGLADEVLRTVTLTCATEECENIGIPIEMEVPEETALFVCGACGTQIATVVEGALGG